MSKTLGPTSLVELLPESIRHDTTVGAAADGVDRALAPLIRGIPHMLWWARLWRDESRLSPAMRHLVAHAGGLKPLSDTELELLAWSMHVDFWDVNWPREVRENLVKYATHWHRLKGTPAGVKMALQLFGIEGVVEEDGTGDDWATWQLGLKNSSAYTIPLNEVAQTAYKVALEMQPQRCRLFRIYNEDFDLRPIRTTLGPPLSEGYLSFYSGMYDPDNPDPDNPIISFGQRLSLESEAYDPNAALGFTVSMPFVAPYIDAFVVGISRLGDVFPKNHAFTFYEKICFLGEDNHPDWQMLPHQISRNQACPSESLKPLSDENTRLGTSHATVVDAPAILGVYRLGESMGRRTFVIHEHFTKRYAQTTEPVNPATSLGSFAFKDCLESSTAALRDQSWSGSKKDRRWWDYTAYTGHDALSEKGEV